MRRKNNHTFNERLYRSILHIKIDNLELIKLKNRTEQPNNLKKNNNNLTCNRRLGPSASK